VDELAIGPTWESILGLPEVEPTQPPKPSLTDVDFRRDVFPILKSRCFECHQGEYADSGVRLDVREEVLGHSSGSPAVVPGKSGQSRMIELIAAADGVVTEDELSYLQTVADAFGFDAATYRRIKASHVGPDREDPYHVLGVAYDADLEVAKQAMHDAFDAVKAGEFGRDILGPLEWHGVVGLGDSAVNLRARIKTKPGLQWGVGRAYTYEVKKAFDAAGIEIPFPHRELKLPKELIDRLSPPRIGEAPT